MYRNDFLQHNDLENDQLVVALTLLADEFPSEEGFNEAFSPIITTYAAALCRVNGTKESQSRDYNPFSHKSGKLIQH
jgi:hypothetical protein